MGGRLRRSRSKEATITGSLAVRLTARQRDEPPSSACTQARSNIERVEATVRSASIGVACSGKTCMMPQTGLGKLRLSRSQLESICSSESAGRR